jgi:penicillin G amidase
MPAVWYEIRLVGGGIEAAGFSLPGTPGIIIGQNRSIAWGVTNAGADVQDLYYERRNPGQPEPVSLRR